MDLAQQAVGQREAFPQAAQATLKRSYVVRDFDHIIEGDTGRLLQLEEQQVGQCDDCVPSIWEESTASLRTYV